MAKCDYNLIILGAGSAGLVAANTAANLNAKVALLEKNKMGGDCLNTGCVPSKTLLRSAKIANYGRRMKEFGLGGEGFNVDFPQVMLRVNRVINRIAINDTVQKYCNMGINCIIGEGKIISPNEVQVNGKILTTKNILIATGSSPFIPPLPGINDVNCYTSDDIWELKEMPRHFVVVGGGSIGCEMAQAFALLGAKVTLIEPSNRILIRDEEDAAKIIMQSMEQIGVEIRTNLRAKRMEKDADGKQWLIVGRKDSEEESKVYFDAILLATGRKANIKGFGLEDVGVKFSKENFIICDEYMRSSVKNIYASGDTAGPFLFAHTAAHQAKFAALNALFSPFKSYKVDYSVIPWCTFTDPEVARVGLNELEAKQKNIPYEVIRYEIDDLDRAIADEEDRGFVKVLTKPGTDKIIGATIVGHNAGEFISEFITAIKFNLGINKILSTVHIYPTFSEANKFVAGRWKLQHTSASFLNMLSKVHSWRRN